jgi:dUTP pyrophosphatase
MNVTRIRDVKLPTRGTEQSAGIDFYVPSDFQPRVLKPGDDVLIPSGIQADVPAGFMLTAFNKSGVSTKKKLMVGAEVVDEDYQGEIHLHLFNNGRTPTLISPGDKIVQFILIPVNYEGINEVEPHELYKELTKRGAGGFGSTDRK